jgi:predicted Zn-dependent protease
MLLLPIALAEVPTDPLKLLQTTLNEATTQLASQAEPPYYLAYTLSESKKITLQGTHGADAGEEREHSRVLDIDLRVGSMRLDNTHKLRDASWFSEPERPSILLPLVADPEVFRKLILRATDDAYRAALKQLIKIRANDAVKVEREDPSDDFTSATPQVFHAKLPELVVDESWWRQVVKETSAIYLEYPVVFDSAVELTTDQDRRWLVSNEGTEVADGRNHLRLATWGVTIAPDGMEIQVYDYLDVPSPEKLPSKEEVMALVRSVADRVTSLRKAPLIEPSDGPAILRGRAAGVFFHEIFGHRIEGHRQKDEEEGQTFTSRVGQLVLPEFLSVYDDPTLQYYQKTDLNGFYRYDDEGMPSERVVLVEDGVLKNFLMSRSPISGFPESNGHGRRQPGYAPVPRQGNLVVEASKTVSYSELRQLLLQEIRRQKKSYGLIFDDISGGFTFTGRSTPNSFSVQPVTVWKVFADGRADQLVRGVDLIGTPLTTFSRILAAADEPEVFNGVCGAESGWIPVSAVSPSLLVQQIEVQRQEKTNQRPPVLPPPGSSLDMPL